VQRIHTTDAAVFDSALSVNMGRSSKSPLSPRMPVLHFPSRNVPQNTDLFCPLNLLTAISVPISSHTGTPGYGTSLLQLLDQIVALIRPVSKQII
jgi:hypothetical protein